MDKFNEFAEEQGIAQSTIKLYKASIKAYVQFCQEYIDTEKINFDDLIDEADAEEENSIRWKHRKLRNRLIKFRKWLYENKSEGTAKQYLSRVRTIYKYYEIEVMDLPPYKSKQIDKTYEKKFEDIPTKEELIQAYHESNNSMKCYIVFAKDTGLSMVDILDLTVGDFITACSDYVSSKELLDQLEEIRNVECPIPVFTGERHKTSSTYTTFCSPESVEHLVEHLIGRDAKIRAKHEKDNTLPSCLTVDDVLIKISADHMSKEFRRINAKLGLGKVGKYVKMRSHQLRAFHATTLKNIDNPMWSVEEIDVLQGRKLDKTHRAYFTESTSKLRQKYYESVDNLMLFKQIHVVDSNKFEEVKRENEHYKVELSKQDDRINKILANQKEIEMLIGL